VCVCLRGRGEVEREDAISHFCPIYPCSYSSSHTPIRPGLQAENDKWLHNPIKDDPVKGSNTEGTITFATAGTS